MARNQTLRISEIKDKVTALLKEKEEYRDNDEKLIARYWADQIRGAGTNLKSITAHELLVKLGEGGLRSSEDIIRTRRLLQSKLPELRGKKWEQRHKDDKQTRREITS
jgi:hypothetical protein